MLIKLETIWFDATKVIPADDNDHLLIRFLHDGETSAYTKGNYDSTYSDDCRSGNFQAFDLCGNKRRVIKDVTHWCFAPGYEVFNYDRKD